MTRVLSALALLPIVVGAIWFLPPYGTLVLALIVLAIASLEYAKMAAQLGARVPSTLVCTAVLATCVATAWASDGFALVTVLAAVLLAFGAGALTQGVRGPETLHAVTAGVFAAVYLGLPIGALVALRVRAGREALLLLLLVIMISDTAQYYAGRAFGRRLLAPRISPKKTVEGAVGGVVAGVLATVLIGRVWLPPVGMGTLAAMGAVLVLAGIAGDLFESLLKRAAQLKDTSGLIPGHGGMLDRIDSLLFAAPIYYALVLYLTRYS